MDINYSESLNTCYPELWLNMFSSQITEQTDFNVNYCLASFEIIACTVKHVILALSRYASMVHAYREQSLYIDSENAEIT